MLEQPFAFRYKFTLVKFTAGGASHYYSNPDYDEERDTIISDDSYSDEQPKSVHPLSLLHRQDFIDVSLFYISTSLLSFVFRLYR